MSLNYTAALVAIATLNFDRLVEFYEALLTLKPTAYTPNVYAEFQLPGVKLGIYRPNMNDELRIASVELRSLTFHESRVTPISLCLEVVNLEAAIAHITELGYPPTEAILTASHGREIYAYDPDGNRLILHQGFNQPLGCL